MIVAVLVVVAGLGLKLIMTPAGKVPGVKVTGPLNPFCGVIVIAEVPEVLLPTLARAKATLKPGPVIVSDPSPK